MEKPKREKKKNDSKLIAAAREIRDRWLEQQAAIVALPQGKYAVGRAIETASVPRLEAA